MRTILVIFLIALGGTTFAQDVTTARSSPGAPSVAFGPSSHQSIGDEPPIRHITDSLLQSPEGRASLEAFHQARDAGTLPTAKAAETYAVGDTTEFNVYNVDETRWMQNISFVLKRKGPALYLWVELTELDSSYVRERDADSLYSALQERTPQQSHDPTEGIIVNNNEVFGEPSDIDDNNRVHVLLTDVKDGREKTSEAPFVAGFFHPEDLNPNNSSANQGEVLYLDTRPGIYTDDGEYRLSINLQATAAHEYQHLIHANYDVNEVTFVNEGLSEWAEILNGYPLRSTNYLSRANDSTGYNVNLFLWRDGEDNVLYDYQRAGLFTHYMAEQFGVMETGAVTRSSRDGVNGLTSTVLQNKTFENFLLDFHTANSLNDVTVDPAYGYVDQGRKGVDAAPAFAYDGRTDRRTPQQRATVSAGAVQYLEWKHVENLQIDIDIDAESVDQEEEDPALLRERFRVRVLARRTNGTLETNTLTLPQTKMLEGTFERVTLVVAHLAPQRREADIRFSADWKQREQTYNSVEIAYDNGTPKINEGSPVLFTTGTGDAGVQATRFSVPDPETAILSQVSFAFYYLSQFQDGLPRDAPRDFNLHVWENSPNRSPGDEIFSVTLDDPRSWSPVYRDYDRFTIDLAQYQDQLTNLPDTIFVGVSETGEDENYMVLAPAPYDEANTSFIGTKIGSDSTAWEPLWDIELQNGISLENTTLPTRAEFLVADTTDEDIQPAPDSLKLAPNYPNPFNHTTRIELSIPDESHVSLRVYDVLGRHVATLVDQVLPARMHPITVNARTWSSGVYFYVLEYQEQRLSRKMLLIK
jgi:hypothetical protein